MLWTLLWGMFFLRTGGSLGFSPTDKELDSSCSFERLPRISTDKSFDLSYGQGARYGQTARLAFLGPDFYGQAARWAVLGSDFYGQVERYDYQVVWSTGVASRPWLAPASSGWLWLTLAWRFSASVAFWFSFFLTIWLSG